MAAGLPSVLYALQGVLTYAAYQNLDSFAFNGLTQMKTLTAALCCYRVLGKAQSPTQIFALVILSVTPLLFEGKFQDMVNRNQQTRDHSDIARDEGVEKIAWKRRLVWGIIPCLGATLLSGLAGALSQKSLQMSVGSSMMMMDRNPYFYSVEISFFSAACLLISMATSSKRDDDNNNNNNKNYKHGLIRFEHWSWKTFVPLFVKAMGGILTAMVHKHAGSVMKGFSLVLGLIFSALLQTILDGKDLTGGQVIGTVLVLISSWLHFTSPPM
jgi:UDP-sugar transporter A1/2/3